jgi:hypothetical protein
MVKRAWLGPLFAALFLAPAAQAKLVPTFSEHSVKPGDVSRLELGEGAAEFLAPLKVYLVPLEVADRARAQSDPRLTKIGELGSPGHFDVPRTLRFVVPELEPGHYTAAVWFKGTETGRWHNALVGIHPRLVIRRAAGIGQVQRTGAGGSASSDDEGTFFRSGLALGSAALVAGLALWRWLRSAQAEGA